MKKGSFLLTLVAAAVISVSGGIGEASTALAAQVNNTTKDYQNHPNKAEIEYVIKNKLMWLFPDGNFRPDQVITQADLVAGLSNVKGLTVGEQVPEMPANHWAKTYYERAKKEGILIGVEINPNKVLTRDEAAQIMVNAWESLRKTRTLKEQGTSPHPYSQMAVARGWLPAKVGSFPNGVSTTLYDGVTNATRAEQAFALAELHRDLVGIQNGEKIMSQLHSSLKLSNGRLTGQVPNTQGYSASVLILLKDGKSFDYKSGDAFSVDVNQARIMQVRVTRKGEAISLSIYTYLKLPHSLERVNVRR